MVTMEQDKVGIILNKIPVDFYTGYDDTNYIKLNYCKFESWNGNTFVDAVNSMDPNSSLYRMSTILDSMKTDTTTLNKFYVVTNGPVFGILSAANISSDAMYIYISLL